MKPNEVITSSIGDVLTYIEGYYNRLAHDYTQTRLLSYLMVNLVADQKQDIEDWMPLWFDPSPEERRIKGEVESLKKGMVAELEIEHYRKLGIDI